MTHAIADRRASIPRPMIGNKNPAVIFLWKHIARVKTHPDRSHMCRQIPSRRHRFRARMLAAKLRIRNIFTVAVRKPEIHPRVRRIIQFVRWNVVAHVVAPIVGEPHLPRLRLPIESHRIAHAPSAYASMPDPSACIRKMFATRLSADSHTLHGAPTPTYSHPSGPKRMY